jgi:hypothetical protein
MRLPGGAAVDTIAMPLGLAFGFATVGVSFVDWLPHNHIPTQEIYVLFMSTEVFVLLYSLAVPLATRRECHTLLKRRV